MAWTFFVAQGYTCTALLLYFLYCFHASMRTYYFRLATNANRLIWVYSLLLLAQMVFQTLTGVIIGFITGFALYDFFITETWFYFMPPVIIITGFLFKQVRQQAVWILLPISILLNLIILPDRLDYEIAFRFTGEITISTIQFFLLYGLIFFLLTFLVEKAGKQLRKSLAKEEDRRLPDRI